MTDDPSLDGRAGLRAHLIAMRAEPVNWLVRDGIDGGTLALWAGISAAIEATEVSVEAPADMVAAGRPSSAMTAV